MPITPKCLQYRGNSRVVGKQETGIRPDNFSIARHPATNPADGLTGICAQGLSIRLTMCVAFAGSSLQAIGRVQRAHVGFVTEPDGFAVRIHVAGKVNVPHGDESHLGRRAQFLQRLASAGIYCNAIQH